MTIILCGFMGCGKSTIGKELTTLYSRRGKTSFTDLDQMIESRESATIPEIFKEEGEKGFRTKEYEALKSYLDATEGQEGVHILSLGGGTLTDGRSRELLANQESPFVKVYLRGSIDTLVNNLCKNDISSRPMLSQRQDLRQRVEQLMSQREEIYRNFAQIVIDIDSSTPEEIAETLLGALDSL